MVYLRYSLAVIFEVYGAIRYGATSLPQVGSYQGTQGTDKAMYPKGAEKIDSSLSIHP